MSLTLGGSSSLRSLVAPRCTDSQRSPLGTVAMGDLAVSSPSDPYC